MAIFEKEKLQEFQKELEKTGEIEKMSYAEFKKYYKERTELQKLLQEEGKLMTAVQSQSEALAGQVQKVVNHQKDFNRSTDSIAAKFNTLLQTFEDITTTSVSSLRTEEAVLQQSEKKLEVEKDVLDTYKNQVTERAKLTTTAPPREEQTVNNPSPPPPSTSVQKVEVSIKQTKPLPPAELSPFRQLTTVIRDLTTSIKDLTLSAIKPLQNSTTQNTSAVDTLNQQIAQNSKTVDNANITNTSTSNQLQEQLSNSTETVKNSSVSNTSTSNQLQQALSNSNQAITSNNRALTNSNQTLQSNTDQTTAVTSQLQESLSNNTQATSNNNQSLQSNTDQSTSITGQLQEAVSNSSQTFQFAADQTTSNINQVQQALSDSSQALQSTVNQNTAITDQIQQTLSNSNQASQLTTNRATSAINQLQQQISSDEKTVQTTSSNTTAANTDLSQKLTANVNTSESTANQIAASNTQLGQEVKDAGQAISNTAQIAENAPTSPTIPPASPRDTAGASQRKAKEIFQEELQTALPGQKITPEVLDKVVIASEKFHESVRSTNDEIEQELVGYSTIKNTLGSLFDAIKQITTNLKKGGETAGEYNTLLTGTSGIMRTLNKQTDDLVYNQTRLAEGELTLRDVRGDVAKSLGVQQAVDLQIAVIKEKQARLESDKAAASGSAAEAIQTEIQNLSTLIDQLDAAKKEAQGLTVQFEKQAKEAAKIEQKIGLAGKLLGGLKKVPVLGDVLDFEGAEKSMRAFAAAGGSSFKTLLVGAEVLGSSLTAALGPIGLIILGIQAVVTVVKFFKDAMFEADKQVTDIAKQLGVSKDEAAKVRDRFFSIKETARDLGGTFEHQVLLQKEIAESQAKFNELLGISLDLTYQQGVEGERLLRQYAAINKFLNLSEEENKGLYTYYVNTGKEVDEIRNTILGTAKISNLTTGYQANTRKVLKEVLTVSNYIKASFGSSLTELTKSVIEAQKFGSSLEKVNQISKGFLDFESSIQKEVEAEVLTGRNLELNAIRFYSATRQTGKVTEELNRLIKEQGPYIKDNAFAFASVADAVNMSEEQLADYITAQQESNKLKAKAQNLDDALIESLQANTALSKDQIKALAKQMANGAITGQQFYDKLKAAGASVENLTKVFGEHAAESLGAQSAQEKFNEALESAKETFKAFVSGGFLDRLADQLIKLITYLEGGIQGTVTGETETKLVAREAQTEVKKAKAKGVTEKEIQDKISEGEFIGQTLLESIMSPLTNLFAGPEQAAINSMSKAYSHLKSEKAKELIIKKENQESTQETVKSHAEGGQIAKGGIMTAEVHSGELISGMNTRESFIQTYRNTEKLIESMTSNKELLAAIREQNLLLASIRDKDTTVILDGEKVGRGVSYAVGRQVAQSPGNLLNANSFV